MHKRILQKTDWKDQEHCCQEQIVLQAIGTIWNLTLGCCEMDINFFLWLNLEFVGSLQ